MLTNFVDGANVRVIQGGCSGSLSTEAFKGLCVFRKVIRKEFQGHEATKFGVLGLVHHAHTTATESFKYAVVGDRLPEEWRRVCHGALILGCGREQVNEGKHLKYLIRSQIVVKVAPAMPDRKNQVR
jgi:hypothetical protein